MTEQILVIDYEHATECVYENSQDFLKEIQETNSAAKAWREAVDEGFVKIYKIKEGKFKEIKLRYETRITYTLLD